MYKPTRSIVRGLVLAAGALALSACATAGSGYYDSGYGYDTGYGYGGGYYDNYANYPSFSGTVIIDGRSHRGLHYRDGRRGREFWHEGRWRRGDWDGRRDGRRDWRR